MTIPHFTFPPGTHLFPENGAVQAYHEQILTHWNLWKHVYLNHAVERARWNATTAQWQVRVSHSNTTHEHSFDHLIVANGHYHYPSIPNLPGREEWAKGAGRAVFHSIFYRKPDQFEGRDVLVVGGGSSGSDIAKRIVGYAASVSIVLISFLTLAAHLACTGHSCGEE